MLLMLKKKRILFNFGCEDHNFAYDSFRFTFRKNMTPKQWSMGNLANFIFEEK